MKKQTQSIATNAVQNVLDSFDKALKVKKIQAKCPEYSHGYISETNKKCMNSIFLRQPTKLKGFYQKQIQQDLKPNNIKPDSKANCRVSSVYMVDKAKIANKDKKSRSTYRGISRGTTTGRGTTGKLSKRQQPQIVDIEKYKIIPPFENNKLIQLENQKKQQKDDQQKQLRKDLKRRRQLQKQLEEQQQRRLQKLRNRKKLVLPRHKFTYTFNGDFMFQRNRNRRHFDISQMKVSNSVDLKRNQKVIMTERVKKRKRQQTQSNSEQLNLRYKKVNLFNNSNNRQTSHMPFMKMKENVVMHQNNLVNEGNSQQKITLKVFRQSNQHKSFRLFNERSENSQEKSDNLEQRSQKKSQETYEETPGKLTAKFRDFSLRKSFNFDRVNFPKENSIHRYYKHNFNLDRKLYESQYDSKVLDA